MPLSVGENPGPIGGRQFSTFVGQYVMHKYGQPLVLGPHGNPTR